MKWWVVEERSEGREEGGGKMNEGEGEGRKVKRAEVRSDEREWRSRR